MKTLTLAAIRCSLIFLLAAFAQAGSATWRTEPPNNFGNWTFDRNWDPPTAPNGMMDIATFARSNVNGVNIFSRNIEVYGITFNGDAAANTFTITVSPGFTLTLSGVNGGITNSSGIMQNFMTGANRNGSFGQIVFKNNATAGSSTKFTNMGSTLATQNGGKILFNTEEEADSHAKAGSGMFINNGGRDDGAQGGVIEFHSKSSAGGRPS